MGSLNTLVAPTVYLDTNIFIYAVEDFTSLGDKLRHLFSRFDSGELHAVTSELTLAETLVKPIRQMNAAVQDTYEKMLQSTSSLSVIPVDRQILVSAARLRATSSIKLPDAIHVATSLSRSCSTFLSNDLRLETVAALSVLAISKLP
jgi:predicted nucleic acid-binding protein